MKQRYSDEQIINAIDRWVVGKNAERNRIILKLRFVDGYTYDQIDDWLNRNNELPERYKIQTRQIARVVSEWSIVIFDKLAT